MSETSNESAQNVESLPPWAQDLIKSLNTSDGAKRIEIRNLTKERDDLRAAKESLEADASAAATASESLTQELSRERFGRTFDRLASERSIPLDIASTVDAKTEEEAIAKLDALAAWRGTSGTPTPRVDPAQVSDISLTAEEQRQADADAFFS